MYRVMDANDMLCLNMLINNKKINKELLKKDIKIVDYNGVIRKINARLESTLYTKLRSLDQKDHEAFVKAVEDFINTWKGDIVYP